MTTEFKRLVVYLPKEVKEQFRELAFDRRMSQSQLAGVLLTQYLQEQQQEADE